MNAAVAFVFVTVLLDMLALGVMIPVLPRLVVEFLGGDNARAATIYGAFGTVWAAMQFVFSPVVGALSDRFGRRTIILLSNLGLGLDYIFMAVAPTLGWLFVGRVISGITSSSIATAGAYIADVTPPEKRAKRFGMIGAAFGIGFILGPAVGGGVAAARAPHVIRVASRQPGRRHCAAPRLSGRPRPRGCDLPLTRGPRRAAQHVRPVCHVQIRLGRACDRLHADGGGRRHADRVRVRDRPDGEAPRRATRDVPRPRAGAAGFAFYAVAATGTLLLAGIPILGLYGLSSPAMQALMSRRVGVSEQGRLQGALASLMGIAGVIAPALFTLTFAAFVGPLRDVGLPGAPFYLAALLLVAAVLVSGRATRQVA